MRIRNPSWPDFDTLPAGESWEVYAYLQVRPQGMTAADTLKTRVIGLTGELSGPDAVGNYSSYVIGPASQTTYLSESPTNLDLEYPSAFFGGSVEVNLRHADGTGASPLLYRFDMFVQFESGVGTDEFIDVPVSDAAILQGYSDGIAPFLVTDESPGPGPEPEPEPTCFWTDLTANLVQVCAIDPPEPGGGMYISTPAPYAVGESGAAILIDLTGCADAQGKNLRVVFDSFDTTGMWSEVSVLFGSLKSWGLNVATGTNNQNLNPATVYNPSSGSEPGIAPLSGAVVGSLDYEGQPHEAILIRHGGTTGSFFYELAVEVNDGEWRGLKGDGAIVTIRGNNAEMIDPDPAGSGALVIVHGGS